MAESIEVSRSDEEQAQALERALAAPRPEAFDICAVWKVIKPFWPWIVELAKKIPKVGAIVAKALQWLGDALDKYCAGK